MNMFLAASMETEEEGEEGRSWKQEQQEEREEEEGEGWRGDEGRRRGKRKMFLMTLESDTRTATQLPLQDFFFVSSSPPLPPSFPLLRPPSPHSFSSVFPSKAR